MRRHAQLDMEPIYGFFHSLCRLAHQMFFRGDVKGLEYLPKTGGYIVAANHASLLDPPMVGQFLNRQAAFFARKTLWKPGVAAWWLDAVGTIPVDRDGGQDVGAIKRVLKALANDKVMILFPEGTRSPDGNLQKPKPGVGMIVCRTQVPVVPARIFNSANAFGKGGGLQPGTPVSVVFGRPLSPAYYDPGAGKDRYQEASERIMAAIAQLECPEPAVI
jgi:1-acyl-sn-glycerol-3-phosphate acyltransferase